MHRESTRPRPWCRDRALAQKALDETFRPHVGALGCATHLEPEFGRDDGMGASKTPRVSQGGHGQREACCRRERAAFIAEPRLAPGTLRLLQICWITAVSGGSGVCYCWKVHILSFNQIKCICGLHNHLQALIIFFCLALH